MLSDPQRYVYSAVNERPPLVFPNGERIAVFIVPNVEYLEYMPPPNPVRPPYQRPAPDIAAFQNRDYGNRVAVWRLFELFDQLGIRATASMNVAVFEHFPQIAEAMAKRDWDYQSHGIYNTRFVLGMDEAEEAEMIHTVNEICKKATGKYLSGWLGPSLTANLATCDLLAAEGIKYCADMFHDDEPTEFIVKSGKLISLPYSVEINSGVALGGQGQTPASFARMIKDQFDVLYAEGATRPKVMAVCLHPYAVTSPSRVKYLRDAIEHIQSHSGVWLTTAGDIADWYYASTFGKRYPVLEAANA
ncbi:MAG: polysaccharide deacetylase family protein [bacterium]